MNREKEQKDYERLFAAAERRMLECKSRRDAAGWRDLAWQMAREGLRRKVLSSERVEAVQERMDALMAGRFPQQKK